MAIISISIEKSLTEIISGIPKSIEINANIPCTIFYTLDGSDPNTFSEIYTGKIFLPREKSYINIKIFATNGIDNSPILSEEYFTSLVNKNIRAPFVGTSAEPDSYNYAQFPFGSASSTPDIVYNNGPTNHLSMSDGVSTQFPNAFNADGYPTNFTNNPYNRNYYPIAYNYKKEKGLPKVGTRPAHIRQILENPIPEETEQFSKTFDPRAMVVFQRFEDEDPSNPTQLNKRYYQQDRMEKDRDASAYFIAGADTQSFSGSFVRSHYNPRTNEMNYYYVDTNTRKWIISTQPHNPTGDAADGNFAGMFMDRAPGVGKIFQWNKFGRRHLF